MTESNLEAESPSYDYYIRAYVYDSEACSYGYCLLTVTVNFTNFVSISSRIVYFFYLRHSMLRCFAKYVAFVQYVYKFLRMYTRCRAH